MQNMADIRCRSSAESVYVNSVEMLKRYKTTYFYNFLSIFVNNNNLFGGDGGAKSCLCSSAMSTNFDLMRVILVAHISIKVPDED